MLVNLYHMVHRSKIMAYETASDSCTVITQPPYSFAACRVSGRLCRLNFPGQASGRLVMLQNTSSIEPVLFQTIPSQHRTIVATGVLFRNQTLSQSN